jgi:hypothetical protein
LLRKVERTMPDYISLIGLMGLQFVPLYIPIAVTIIGGIRRGREAVGATRPAVDPAAVIARRSEGVLPNAARPIVEPV